MIRGNLFGSLHQSCLQRVHSSDSQAFWNGKNKRCIFDSIKSQDVERQTQGPLAAFAKLGQGAIHQRLLSGLYLLPDRTRRSSKNVSRSRAKARLIAGWLRCTRPAALVTLRSSSSACSGMRRFKSRARRFSFCMSDHYNYACVALLVLSVLIARRAKCATHMH